MSTWKPWMSGVVVCVIGMLQGMFLRDPVIGHLYIAAAVVIISIHGRD